MYICSEHEPNAGNCETRRSICPNDTKSSIGGQHSNASYHAQDSQLCGATVAGGKVADIDPRRPEGGWCFGEGRAKSERGGMKLAREVESKPLSSARRNFPPPPLFFALASLSSAARPLHREPALLCESFSFSFSFSFSSRPAFSLSFSLFPLPPFQTRVFSLFKHPTRRRDLT